MESNLCMDVKNVNTKIDPFIPKNEMRQQIEFVSVRPSS